MLNTINNRYEYRLNKWGQVVYARDLKTGRFVKHSLVQNLVDNAKNDSIECFIYLVLSIIANVIAFTAIAIH